MPLAIFLFAATTAATTGAATAAVGFRGLLLWQSTHGVISRFAWLRCDLQ